MDLQCFCVAGSGPGGSGSLQCGVLHGGAADQRVWNSHGSGRSARARAAGRLRVDSGSVGSGILAGLALTLALNTIIAKWAEGNSRDPMILLVGNAAVELGIRGCLRNTGAARLQSGSYDGAALRMSVASNSRAVGECRACKFLAIRPEGLHRIHTGCSSRWNVGCP